MASRGIRVPLDLPENAQDLHAALAMANGVAQEEAQEWLAGKFGILPYIANRPSVSVQAENVFRQLAAESLGLEDEPWLPVGSLGPLLIIGHYDPAARAKWGVPDAFTIPVLLEQRQYRGYAEVLAERLEAKPIVPREAPLEPRPLGESPSPETALKWLLSDYPFGEEERKRLEGCLEPLSSVAAANVTNL
ncbi:MAG: hypothetical protein ACO3L2_08365, partial [Chthoniobacterales bacterium]